MLRWPSFLLAAGAALAVPAAARDSIGLFGSWAALRDPEVPRCYAIAIAQPSKLNRDFQPYADVSIWPKRGVRGAVHFRLSRTLGSGAITLALGGQHFALAGRGGDAWPQDPRSDPAIVAAMRQGGEMTVSARGADGHGFSNTWELAGAATAIDAAMIGCAPPR